MKLDYDVVIVGAGPAGIAAATELKAQGIHDIVILEKEDAAGGPARYSFLPTFGIPVFKCPMTGPQFVKKILKMRGNVPILTEATVTAIHRDGRLTVATSSDGLLHEISGKRVILATGASETIPAPYAIEKPSKLAPQPKPAPELLLSTSKATAKFQLYSDLQFTHEAQRNAHRQTGDDPLLRYETSLNTQTDPHGEPSSMAPKNRSGSTEVNSSASVEDPQEAKLRYSEDDDSDRIDRYLESVNPAPINDLETQSAPMPIDEGMSNLNSEGESPAGIGRLMNPETASGDAMQITISNSSQEDNTQDANDNRLNVRELDSSPPLTDLNASTVDNELLFSRAAEETLNSLSRTSCYNGCDTIKDSPHNSDMFETQIPSDEESINNATEANSPLKGIMTSEMLQKSINIEKNLPCRSPIIIGTEPVSFSSLLTLYKNRVKAKAMLEEQQSVRAHGLHTLLAKAIKTPILCRTKLIEIGGTGRVEFVTVETDGERRKIECDAVIFTGGFNGANHLVINSHLDRCPHTDMPVVDSLGRCSDGIYYAIGNMTHPGDFGDRCYLEGQHIGLAVAFDLKVPPVKNSARIAIEHDERILFTSPSCLTVNGKPQTFDMNFRVKEACTGMVVISSGDKILFRRKRRCLPGRKIVLNNIKTDLSPHSTSNISVRILPR